MSLKYQFKREHMLNYFNPSRCLIVCICWVLFALIPFNHPRAATQFTKADSNSFYFNKDGQEIKLVTPFKSPQFLGVLDDGTVAPYSLYLAQACTQCPVDPPSVYMQKIEGQNNKPFQFVYPGKITDTKKGQIVFDSRAFYGECIKGVKSAYVSFQKEIVDRRRGLQRSVFVAKPGDQKPQEKLMERGLPAVETALQLVKKKVCFEIPPKNRKVLSRPLDLSSQKGLEDDEDETEEFERKKGFDETEPNPDAPNTDTSGFETGDAVNSTANKKEENKVEKKQ